MQLSMIKRESSALLSLGRGCVSKTTRLWTQRSKNFSGEWSMYKSMWMWLFTWCKGKAVFINSFVHKYSTIPPCPSKLLNLNYRVPLRRLKGLTEPTLSCKWNLMPLNRTLIQILASQRILIPKVGSTGYLTTFIERAASALLRIGLLRFASPIRFADPGVPGHGPHLRASVDTYKAL